NDIDETPVVINKPPVANNDTATTDEDNSTTINVLANDTDENGDTLSITSVSGSPTGSVTIDGDNIVYNPNGQFESLNAGETATDTFTYRVDDGNGLSDTATVTVTINGVDEVINNQPPVANNDTATTNQNQAVTISVTDLLANDTDVEGDTLSITSVGNAANGNVALNGNNVLFTPDAGFSGAASFEYTLSDGSETDNAIVSVTVNSLSSVEILGTPGRDTLTGDSADNIITGFQGRDMLTGNGGSDQFVYTDIRDAGDIITDFELGSDKIVLTQLLDSIGYAGSDAIGDGYVSFGSSRGDAFVQIDQDGMGSDFISRPLVLLQGVTEENLSANAENSFIF
ncbi:MAG: Ig-like domain-containing protein, partial [Cyanobacteria bacterium J06629_18]